jgi:hypothetical protein
MTHDWGVHTIAPGRGLGGRGITRSGACTRARHRLDYASIRGRGWGFRSVRLGGARRPGLLRVRTLGGRRRRPAILRQNSRLGSTRGLEKIGGLGRTSSLGRTSGLRKISGLRLGKTSGPIRSIRNSGPRGHTRTLRPSPVATRRHALRTHPALPRTNGRMINVGDYRVHHGSTLPWLYAFQLDVLQVNVFHDPVFHDPL